MRPNGPANLPVCAPHPTPAVAARHRRTLRHARQNNAAAPWVSRQRRMARPTDIRTMIPPGGPGLQVVLTLRQEPGTRGGWRGSRPRSADGTEGRLDQRQRSATMKYRSG